MTATRAPERTKLALLRERDLRLVLGAQLASLLGDGIVPVALAFAVLDLTGSATDLGLVLAARTVPLVGCVLIGGVAADRLSRRRVMISADLARLTGQGLLGALLIAGEAQLWQLIAVQAVMGAASGFFLPASTGLIPMVIAKPQLQTANALRAIAKSTGGISGPLVGGVLVAALGSGAALLADAATYAVSAALLARVRLPESPRERPATSMLTDLRDGWIELTSRTWLWTSTLAASIMNMLHAAFLVLGPLVALRQHGGAGAWGAILAARAGGQLAGGVVSLHMRAHRPLLAAVIGLQLLTLPIVLLAAGAPVIAIAAAAALAGIGVVVWNTLYETVLQQRVALSSLSRVSAYDWLGSLAFQPLGLAIAGPTAGWLGVAGALYLAALLQLATLAALVCVRDVRTLGSPATPLRHA